MTTNIMRLYTDSDSDSDTEFFDSRNYNSKGGIFSNNAHHLQPGMYKEYPEHEFEVNHSKRRFNRADLDIDDDASIGSVAENISRKNFPSLREFDLDSDNDSDVAPYNKPTVIATDDDIEDFMGGGGAEDSKSVGEQSVGEEMTEEMEEAIEENTEENTEGKVASTTVLKQAREAFAKTKGKGKVVEVSKPSDEESEGLIPDTEENLERAIEQNVKTFETAIEGKKPSRQRAIIESLSSNIAEKASNASKKISNMANPPRSLIDLQESLLKDLQKDQTKESMKELITKALKVQMIIKQVGSSNKKTQPNKSLVVGKLTQTLEMVAKGTKGYKSLAINGKIIDAKTSPMEIEKARDEVSTSDLPNKKALLLKLNRSLRTSNKYVANAPAREAKALEKKQKGLAKRTKISA